MLSKTDITNLSTKEKASLLTILTSVTFTVLKFVVFFLSGSIAVLSEAWHSFGDIFTSVLVFLSFRRDRSRSEAQETSREPGDGPSELGFLDRLSTEMKVSLFIGCVLVVIAIGILYKVLTSRPTTIEKPVLSGILFILFSTGSYFLYRFSTTLGTAEGSAALVSDGLHSKADMYNSLLTGFSLILYAFGVNLDRIVGGLLAFFLLSYAVEMFANVFAMHREGSTRYRRVYSFTSVIAKGAGLLTFRNILSYIDRATGLDLGSSRICRKLERWKAVLIALPLVLLYLATAVVVVPVDEVAVIERFGKPLSEEEILGPGLHITCPWPIDRVERVGTKKIREMRLGNVSYESGYALIWTRQHGQEEHFLSGDNNFFNPYLILHYCIDDPMSYLYRQSRPEELVENLAYRELNEIFVTKNFERISVSYRKDLEHDFGERLQRRLDRHEVGVEIVNVVIKDIHPPLFISSSYEDVIAAFQEKQRDMNNALSYRNGEIPVAHGKAVRLVEEAGAYVTDRVLRAEGDAGKFLSVHSAYAESPAISRKRMYLDMIRQSICNTSRIIVDPSIGEADVWLNNTTIPGLDGRSRQEGDNR